jgi:hypothetical protein
VGGTIDTKDNDGDTALSLHAMRGSPLGGHGPYEWGGADVLLRNVVAGQLSLRSM